MKLDVLPPARIVNVNVPASLPGVVAFGESRTLVGSALVIVTCTLPAGAGASNTTLACACKSLPTAPLLIKARGPVTFAVIACRLFGVLKPAGVSKLTVVVPAEAGSNAVALSKTLAPTTTGLVVIVPTAVVPLATPTLTGPIPARND